MLGVPEGGTQMLGMPAPPPPAPPPRRTDLPYFTLAEVEEMLRILQRLDPPGACARATKLRAWANAMPPSDS